MREKKEKTNKSILFFEMEIQIGKSENQKTRKSKNQKIRKSENQKKYASYPTYPTYPTYPSLKYLPNRIVFSKARFLCFCLTDISLHPTLACSVSPTIVSVSPLSVL